MVERFKIQNSISCWELSISRGAMTSLYSQINLNVVTMTSLYSQINLNVVTMTSLYSQVNLMSLSRN